VIAAILQHKPSIAFGNVIGSSISNILGAFSLGLLFHPGDILFDRSAKIYTSILFLITTAFTIITLTDQLGRAAGIFFIVTFAVYTLSIVYGIYKGVLDVPEDEESQSDEDDESEGAGFDEMDGTAEVSLNETTALLPDGRKGLDNHKPRRSLSWHVLQLVLGFIALAMSGFVLSHTAASLASSMHLSNTVIGITILSFATTLPEKFLSVLSGIRGHGGIVVASTAGSNIFLLTLCLGIIFVVGNTDKKLEDGVVSFEIWTAWASSAILMAIVFLGGMRWMGAVLLAGYVAFIVLEFTVYRR
jgi:Ca2+/Na+ antiporter